MDFVALNVGTNKSTPKLKMQNSQFKTLLFGATSLLTEKPFITKKRFSSPDIRQFPANNDLV